MPEQQPRWWFDRGPWDGPGSQTPALTPTPVLPPQTQPAAPGFTRNVGYGAARLNTGLRSEISNATKFRIKLTGNKEVSLLESTVFPIGF